MSRELIARIDSVRVEPFTWSGHNTHRARIHAAITLAERLERLRDENVVIIAHSHGGNVALAAARLAGRTRRTRALVALGTPFFAPGRPVEKLGSIAVTLGVGCLAVTILAFIGAVPSFAVVVLGGLLVIHTVAYLYSLVNRRWINRDWITYDALDAMAGFREVVFYTVDRDGSRITRPVDSEPRRLVGPRRDLPIDVIALPGDEAGLGLAAGQFLGLLSGSMARIVNYVSWGAGMGVWEVVVLFLIGVMWLAVIAVLGIPVMAYVATGDLQDALARLADMRHGDWSLAANPLFDLIDEVLPGRREQAAALLGGALTVLVTAVGIATGCLVVLVVALATLFTVLLLEALAVGFDGASFIWDLPMTTTSVPVGESQVTLVSAITTDYGKLAHSSLTTSPEAITKVVDIVDRILTSSEGRATAPRRSAPPRPPRQADRGRGPPPTSRDDRPTTG